jgi:hypothetical protein
MEDNEAKTTGRMNTQQSFLLIKWGLVVDFA